MTQPIIDELLFKVAKASQTPHNSLHAHQMSRDFGMLMGMKAILDLVEPYNVNQDEVTRLLNEIKVDYE